MEFEITRVPVIRVVPDDVMEEAEEFEPVAQALFQRIAQALEAEGEDNDGAPQA